MNSLIGFACSPSDTTHGTPGAAFASTVAQLFRQKRRHRIHIARVECAMHLRFAPDVPGSNTGKSNRQSAKQTSGTQKTSRLSRRAPRRTSPETHQSSWRNKRLGIKLETAILCAFLTNCVIQLFICQSHANLFMLRSEIITSVTVRQHILSNPD